jgi:methionyl-tRNA formyltransferase
VAVVCQPDQRVGRGLKWSTPPVKARAEARGLAVHQPASVRSPEFAEWLRGLGVDVALVLAYGRILPKAVLDAPKQGCMNLHASLLPKYRGAAPINWALFHGETTTGMALMQMDEGMDTGPVFTARELAINERDDAGALATRLGALAAEMVRLDLPRAVSGELIPVPQDEAGATYAPLIEKHHLAIDWTRSATEIANQVRAFAPRPGARTELPGGTGLRILEAESDATFLDESGAPVGSVAVPDKRSCLVKTGQGWLAIRVAQVDGKRPMSAADLINGRSLAPSTQLTSARR